MSTSRASCTPTGRRTGSVTGMSDPLCAHLTLKSRTSSSERIDRNILIDMYSLCMLAQVV